MMLALIHESPATRRAAERLTDRLREVGETLAVFSDSEEWHGRPEVRFRSLRVDGRMLEVEEIRRQATEWRDVTHIIFDVHADLKPNLASRLLELVDRAVYFVPAASRDAALRRLLALEVPARGWRDKVRPAWVLEGSALVAPAAPNLRDFATRNFKLSEAPPEPNRGRALVHGLERVIHDLRGVRIGLALGGGAARGMAHLGVLKVLEPSGRATQRLKLCHGVSSGRVRVGRPGRAWRPQHCDDRSP